MKLTKYLKKWQDYELSKEHFDKITGEVKPGSKVKIFWDDEDWPSDLYDSGYIFSLPENDQSMDYDVFVHIPKPENPSGRGDCDDEWKHFVDLLTNPILKRIEVIPI